MFITISDENEWESFVEIFIEMEKYHHGEVEPTKEAMGNYLRKRVFDKDSGTEIYKVTINGSLAAFACISIMYPAPLYAGQMFIKQIFVSEKYRNLGIGKSLMSYLAKKALEKDCLRLDWLSDKHNLQVQNFYQSIGGKVLEKVNYFRLSGTRLAELAVSSK
jgi:ribosomal protein S18 acetylase RimI-like enzyme